MVQSPKFPLKVRDLRAVISVSRLKATWKNKVRDALRRQPIPDALEYLDFHTKLDASCTAIESEILSGSYIPRPPIRFLSEKSKGLCRQLVIPSVKDALILQTLSDALWVELKTKAQSKKSFYAPNDHQFSKFIKGHASDYGPVAAWLAFQETIFGFAKTKKYVVVTDIANYYDCISHEHLRNILADLSLAREHALDLLLYILSYMLWQPDYMPRVPIGLPQTNLDAPRLLAHCFLFEIDHLLMHKSGIDFARYMDDIDVGVDTLPEAKAVLRDLDLALQTRQIRLNSGKTKILSELEAYQHFKIGENYLIDHLVERIDKNTVAGKPLIRERRAIELGIRAGLRRGTFSTGNGEKILKRLINLAAQTHASIDDKIFISVMEEWPSLRKTILGWWQRHQHPETKLSLIAGLIEAGTIVDDAALMDIAIALVVASLPNTSIVKGYLARISNAIDHKAPWGFHAKCWIFSKYEDPKSLMRLIETTVSLWVTQEHLSRLAAGMLPRIYGTPDESKFEWIIRRTGNGWATPVLEFHRTLLGGTFGYKAVKGFILAPNFSLPNLISHSKFMMLLSLLHNIDLAPTASAHLKAVHAVALSDPFYKNITP